jgi:hypothetical protein
MEVASGPMSTTRIWQRQDVRTRELMQMSVRMGSYLHALTQHVPAQLPGGLATPFVHSPNPGDFSQATTVDPALGQPGSQNLPQPPLSFGHTRADVSWVDMREYARLRRDDVATRTDTQVEAAVDAPADASTGRPSPLEAVAEVPQLASGGGSVPAHASPRPVAVEYDL